MGLKGDLLERYADRDPKRFVQIDCHDMGAGAVDDVMHPDEDGHAITGHVTTELMIGTSVRVLIHDGVSGFEAVSMLEKITDSLRHGMMRDELNQPAKVVSALADDEIDF